MRVFSKELAAGRSYSEQLQKKAREKLTEHRQSAGQKEKDTRERFERELQQGLGELRQISAEVGEMKEQQEILQTLKEKQEFVLKNFPTLEGNIVEKLKGAQANGVQEILKYLVETEEKQRKRNLWTKVLLWVSLVCSLSCMGGIIALLYYIAL